MTYDFRQIEPLQPFGDLAASSWCSDRHPQPGCSPTTGICKPMDFATLEVYKDLQRQLNRLLAKDGRTLLDVDGRIGPRTLSAINRYAGTGYGHCDEAAVRADVVRTTIRMKADSQSAAAVADPSGSATKASRVDPSTGQMVHPEIRTMGFFGMPWWMLIVAGVTGYMIYQTTGPAKKKRAVSKKKAPAKRRRKSPTKKRRVRRKPKTRTTIVRY